MSKRRRRKRWCRPEVLLSEVGPWFLEQRGLTQLDTLSHSYPSPTPRFIPALPQAVSYQQIKGYTQATQHKGHGSLSLQGLLPGPVTYTVSSPSVCAVLSRNLPSLIRKAPSTGTAANSIKPQSSHVSSMLKAPEVLPYSVNADSFCLSQPDQKSSLQPHSLLQIPTRQSSCNPLSLRRMLRPQDPCTCHP